MIDHDFSHSDICMHIYYPGVPNGAQRGVPDNFFKISKEHFAGYFVLIVQILRTNTGHLSFGLGLQKYFQEPSRLLKIFWSLSIHTCHISRGEGKTHRITEFLTASRRETKTSRKEKNPMLNFSQGNSVAAIIIGRKEKPITSITEILAEVLKLPFSPSHFLDDKCSKNKQPSLAGAETVQVLRLSAQRHAKRSLLQA